MHQLSDILAEFPHSNKPLLRNRAQLRRLLVQPDAKRPAPSALVNATTQNVRTVPLFRTLNLSRGPGGKLSGTLVQPAVKIPVRAVRQGPLAATGIALTVNGTLRGKIMTLNVRTAPGQWSQWTGPVVSATLANGDRALHGGGVLAGGNQAQAKVSTRFAALSALGGALAGGNQTQDIFTVQGSSVVLRAEQLQNPSAVKRVIPAGTLLVPTDFVGQVTQGPDAGTTLSGIVAWPGEQ
jgi:hypothetical protein